MNKRGLTVLSIIFAIFYFMIGMIVYQLIKPDITTQQDASHLNCASPSTDGDAMSCLVTDSIVPILIIAILAATGGILTDKTT